MSECVYQQLALALVIALRAVAALSQDTDLLLPFGLALFKDKIYWTDKMSANIYSANKDTGKQRTIVRAGVSNLMDVRVFHRHRQPQPSMCHANNGGCSHLCLLAPQPLGYACACPTGVKLLTDGRQCASGPTNSLVFAHREDIRQISLDVPYTVDIVLPLPRLKSARAVDSDLKTGEIYWTDTELDVIQKAALDGSNMRVVVADGLIGADGIAIDSTGRKLYWTDGERRSIEVAELNGMHRKALFWSGFEGVKPRALALHYHLALLYWSDWGDTGRIERAGMDGSDRQIFISQNIHWPNGLAIDRPAGRLYWTDAKLKRMESVRLDRGDRRVVLNELPHPYGLVLVGSHVYWTDWETEALHRADKINGSERTVIRARLRGLMDIRSIQRDNVAENVCGSDNGGCSHLCLRSPTPVGYSCACPTGVRIDSDGTTCPTQPSSYLLLVTAESLARLSFDTEARLDVSLPVDGIGDAYAIDYHHNKSLIFYSDIDQHIIRAVDMLNMSSTMNVVTTNLSSPFGLAVDWMASNLYWTDYDRRVVEVARLDGSCRKTLVQTDHYQPRSIAVYPRRGFLFWANIGEEPRIERALLDGSQQFGIITDNLGFPQGLVVDLEERRLFWVDATKDRIEYSNLYGKERKELMPLQSHPFGLTLHGDHIYWTSLFKKTVERAEKMLGRKRTTFHTALHNVMELRFVAADTQTGINPCSVQNGHCSHLCFYTGNLGYRCACPDRPDDIPCSTEPSERVKLSDDQLGDVEDDIEPWDMAPQPPALESSSVLFVLAVTSLCVIAAIVAFFFFAFLYHKRRRRSKKFVYGGVVGGGRGRSVLTFTNPNYSSATASAEHVHPPPEKRPFWAFLKYDRSQERVFDVHSETDSGRQGGGEVEAEAETEVESLTRCAVEFHAGPPG